MSWYPASTSPSPPGLSGAAFAANSTSAAGEAVLFGGWNRTPEGNVVSRGYTWVYTYQNQTWRNVSSVSPTAPTPRSDAAFAFDAVAGLFVLFGGEDRVSSTYYGDTWTFSPLTNVWHEVLAAGPTAPSVRHNPAFAASPIQDLLLLVGGQGYGGLLADTWTYSVAMNAWTNVTAASQPPALVGASLVANDTAFTLFGGSESTGPTNATYTWDPATSVWTSLGVSQAPAPRDDAAAVTLPVGNGSLLIYGGANLTVDFDDAWLFEDGVWTDLGAQAPGGLAGASMGWIPAPWMAIALFGGVTPAGTTSRLLSLGATAPPPAPTLGVPSISAPVTVGSAWYVQVGANQTGGAQIVAVNASMTYPGSSVPLVAKLHRVAGSDVDGVWNVSFPAPGQAGQISLTLAALNDAGVTSNESTLVTVDALPPIPGNLEGVVYGESSVSFPPLAGATVTLGGTYGMTEVTGSNGSYDFPRVPAGTYPLTASGTGFESYTNNSFRMGSVTQVQNIILYTPTKAGATVTGIVRPTFDRSLWLTGAVVSAQALHGGTNATVTTGVYGNYTLGLPIDSQYYVNFSLQGYFNVSTIVNVTSASTYHDDANLTVQNVKYIIQVSTVTFSVPRPSPGSSETVSLTLKTGGNPIPNTNVSWYYYILPNATVNLDINPIAFSPVTGTASLTFTIPTTTPLGSNITVVAAISGGGLPSFGTRGNVTVVAPASSPPSGQVSSTTWVLAAIIGVLAIAFVAYALVTRRSTRVDEIFLIYRGGKLVWHASRTARTDLEAEVVTGMLQAVETFLEKSFSTQGGHLNVLDFADRKLHIVRGDYLVAAALIQGGHEREAIREVTAALTDMEGAWKTILPSWDGAATSLPNLKVYVEALLAGEYRRKSHIETPPVPKA